MTNEEILQNAIYFNGQRKDRVNMLATCRRLGLSNYQLTQFRIWMKINHPELITLMKVAQPIDPVMYQAGIFQIVCEPTGRRLIGSTRTSFTTAKHIHMTYARNINTYHKMNPWLRDQQSIDDINTYGIDSLKFEVLEVLPLTTTTLQTRVARENWLGKFAPNELYSRSVEHSRNIKYEQFMSTEYPKKIRDMTSEIIQLRADRKILETQHADVIIDRQKLQDEFDAATNKNLRRMLRKLIINAIADKKRLAQELQLNLTKLRRLTKLLVDAVEYYDVKNLKVVGRPKFK